MANHTSVIERTLAWGPPRLSLFTYKCHDFVETSLFYKHLAAILITFLVVMIKCVTDGHLTGESFILAQRSQGRWAESSTVGPAHTKGCMFTSQYQESDEHGEAGRRLVVEVPLRFPFSRGRALIQGLAREPVSLVKIL